MAKLLDCEPVGSFEVIDDRLVFPQPVTIEPVYLDGAGGSRFPGLTGAWLEPQTPYIVGIQYQYELADGSGSPVLVQANIEDGSWVSNEALIPGADYRVRARPVGAAANTFGPWSNWAIVTTGTELVVIDTINVGGTPSTTVRDQAAQVPALVIDLSAAEATIAQHQADLYTATTGVIDRLAAARETIYAANIGLVARADAITAQLDTPTTGIVARLTTVEEEVVTNNSASVQRLDALEATVNTAGTGLTAVVAEHSGAIADLETGKAEASRVTLLEARVTTYPNMISNPSGAQDFANWIKTNSANGGQFLAYTDVSWGPWFSTRFEGETGAPGDYRSMRSEPIYGGYGLTHVLSGNAFLRGLEGGSCQLAVYGYTDQSGTQGEYLAAHHYFTQGQIVGPGALPDLIVPTTVGTQSMRVWSQITATGNASYAHWGFWRLKLEVGTVSTAFTDDATSVSLHSRVVSLVSATSDLEAGKADASRVDLLEAQVQTAGTGLLARMTTAEEAVVDLEAQKASVARVELLEATSRFLTNTTFARDFAGDGVGWRNDYTGAPGAGGASVTPLVGNGANGITFPTRTDVGRVMRVAMPAGGFQDISPDAADVLRPGRRLRISSRYQQIAGSLAAVDLFGINLTSGYALGTGYPSTTQNPAPAGWNNISLEVDSDTLIAGSGVFWRSLLRLNAHAVDATSFDVLFIETEDITETHQLDARTTLVEQAAIDLAAGKADASRVTALEATIDTPTTGLVARLATAEQAVVDLETGKADASRVDLLEAKVQTHANLLPNGSGRQGTRGWNSMEWAVADSAWGPYFSRAITPDLAPGNSQSYSDKVILPTGAYTLSARGFTDGMTAGSAGLWVYGYTTTPNGEFTGETFLGALNIPSSSGRAPDYDLTPLTFTVPAGVVAVRVWPTFNNIQATTYTGVNAFWNTKLEAGSGATLYSDEAALTQLAARSTSLEQVTADLETGKAAASRVDLLEAQVQTGGTGLLSRMTSAEAAVVDLETGKASASSLQQLEARVSRPGQNLVRNPSGNALFEHWDNISGFSTNVDLTFGPWFRHRFDNEGAHFATLRTDPFQGGYGQTFVMSGEGFQSGVGGAYADIGVYGYTDEAGTVGETRLSPTYNTIASHNPNVGRFSLTPQVFTTPANIVSFRVWYQLSVTSPGGYSDWGVFKLKVESGSVPTAFTDDASEYDLNAKVTEVREATSTLEGRLESRALLTTTAGNQVSGMQLLAVEGADVGYSTIDFWASAVRISNDGLNPEAPFEVRGDVVRMKAALIDRLSVTTAITVGVFAFPVALEAKLQPAADGEVVGYGGALGQVPNLFFRTEGLDPLNAGESYLQYADDHTETGFIARRKIQTPATPSAYNKTVSAAGPGGTGPTRMIERGADPVSIDNTYQITGSGYVVFRTLGDVGSQEGTCVLKVFQRISGVWSHIGYLYCYASVADAAGAGSGSYTVQEDAQAADTFTCSPSVEAWGLAYDSRTGGVNAGINDYMAVSWTAAGTGSGIRSATSGGQRPIVEVRIKNG